MFLWNIEENAIFAPLRALRETYALLFPQFSVVFPLTQLFHVINLHQINLPMQENINSILPEIENKIFTVRGLPVMLDSDLALLYGVETKRINEAVKRNINRFPDWFMFQMSYTEWENLKCQIGTSSNAGDNASRSQIATLNEKKHVEQDNLRSQFVTSSENDNQQENALRFQIGTLESKSSDSSMVTKCDLRRNKY